VRSADSKKAGVAGLILAIDCRIALAICAAVEQLRSWLLHREHSRLIA
jgi:hypothetical protein